MITQKQNQAITELTNIDNHSLQEVVKKVGISYKTLYRWRKNPEFSSALKESFRQIREEVGSKVATSTYNQSPRTLIRSYNNLTRVIDKKSDNLLLVLNTAPTIIVNIKLFEAKYIELCISLHDLQKNLKEVEREKNASRSK